jgi:hypothetical protein
MTKRREKRARVAIPVRIISQDDAGAQRVSSACTLDVTPTGARLSGVHATTKPGDVIRIERGANKAAYQVRWVGTRDEGRYGQLGLQIMDARFDWGVEVPAAQDDTYDFRPSSDSVTQRERAMRHRCPGMVEINVEADGQSALHIGELGDISALGCYVRMGFPPKPKSSVKLKITVQKPATEIAVKGVVGTSDRGLGMWVNFTEISEHYGVELKGLLQNLQSSN